MERENPMLPSPDELPVFDDSFAPPYEEELEGAITGGGEDPTDLFPDAALPAGGLPAPLAEVDVASAPEAPSDATELPPADPAEVDVASAPEAPSDVTELPPADLAEVDVASRPSADGAPTELPEAPVPKETQPVLAAGDTVADGYVVGEKMDVASGEADLYLCTKEEKTYILKLYRKERALNAEVAEKRLAIDSPYVARLYAYGKVKDRPYEITDYYKNGSLAGRTFTANDLRSFIIPDVNEALHVLHESGIRHRDIKPSNIMLRDDGKHVALIDFGVSSVFESNDDLNLTQTGMTPYYAAPETFLHLYVNESDYYSFGITVYTLFYGATPYEGLPKIDIGRYGFVYSIPFKEDKVIPEDLHDLILGLTYASIVERNDEDNPNRRWTYREVYDFCQGKRPPLPGQSIGKIGKIRPYTLAGETFDTLDALVDGLARHWEEGKKALFRGHITEHFRLEDPNPLLSQICKDAEARGTEEGGHDDRAYFYFLYRLRPSLSVLYWKDARYDSVAALGIDMADALDAAAEQDYALAPPEEALWSDLLSEGILSRFYE